MNKVTKKRIINNMNDHNGKSDVVFLSREQTKELTSPKFLVMVRKNSEHTLSNVSPFLLKKIVDNTCDGEVDHCKKLRNGSILIKTRNEKQAKQLMTLTNITPDICVEVSEHNSLNNTKGVFYTHSLKGMSEEEILENLKTQNVIHIKKILKKEDKNLIETGLFIATFGFNYLPNKITLGYESVILRPYIPYPLRCFNCFRFGHPTKFCKSTKLCDNCSSPVHIDEEEDEICLNGRSCINCIKFNVLGNCYHSPLDKNCPIFLKEKEIQHLKTTRKVSTKEATKMYDEIHSKTYSIRSEMSYDDIELFSNEINILNNNQKYKSTAETNIPNSTNIIAPQNINKSSSTAEISGTKTSRKPNSKSTKPSTIQIPPLNISKRTRRHLKASLKNIN